MCAIGVLRWAHATEPAIKPWRPAAHLSGHHLHAAARCRCRLGLGPPVVLCEAPGGLDLQGYKKNAVIHKLRCLERTAAASAEPTCRCPTAAALFALWQRHSLGHAATRRAAHPSQSVHLPWVGGWRARQSAAGSTRKWRAGHRPATPLTAASRGLTPAGCGVADVCACTRAHLLLCSALQQAPHSARSRHRMKGRPAATGSPAPHGPHPFCCPRPSTHLHAPRQPHLQQVGVVLVPRNPPPHICRRRTQVRLHQACCRAGQSGVVGMRAGWRVVEWVGGPPGVIEWAVTCRLQPQPQRNSAAQRRMARCAHLC